MSGGVISGGWNFVIAAYGVTFAVLFIYGLSILSRLRQERSMDSEKKHE